MSLHRTLPPAHPAGSAAPASATAAPCPTAGPAPHCRAAVLGLGYIGLPTAVMLAAAPNCTVLGVDINPNIVASLSRGRPHITEPGLDTALARAQQGGTLHVAMTPAPADVFVIAVPTPLGPGGTPGLTAVEAAAHSLAPHLAPGNLVILESTVPVGTTARLAGWLAERRPDLSFPAAGSSPPDIHIAHCPERVLPGRILQELAGNDRVIGGATPACARAAADFYGQVVRGACHLTDLATAEMTKLAENAFRDVNIAYANELSLICERAGVNVRDMIALANRHPRVDILEPGPGVGGHCIAVDPWFLAASAPDHTNLIRTARTINDTMPEHVAKQALKQVAHIENPVIACLGLTYKPDVADLRSSPALDVVRKIVKKSAAAHRKTTVIAVEPHITKMPGDLKTTELTTLDNALKRADLAILLVAHTQFNKINTKFNKHTKIINKTNINIPI